MKARILAVIGLACALAVAFGATAIAKPATVKSNFNTDNDGWGTVNNFNGLSILNPAGYLPTGGHPGGAIYADDDDSGAGEQITAFVDFQNRFMGDFSAYYGGKIKFDLLENKHTSKPARLVFSTGTNSSGKAFFAKTKPAPGTSWQHYSVPLTAKRWDFVNFHGPNGGPRKPATQKIMKHALSQLQGVDVVADYSHAAGERVTLDNYAWAPPKR